MPSTQYAYDEAAWAQGSTAFSTFADTLKDLSSDAGTINTNAESDARLFAEKCSLEDGTASTVQARAGDAEKALKTYESNMRWVEAQVSKFNSDAGEQVDDSTASTEDIPSPVMNIMGDRKLGPEDDTTDFPVIDPTVPIYVGTSPYDTNTTQPIQLPNFGR